MLKNSAKKENYSRSNLSRIGLINIVLMKQNYCFVFNIKKIFGENRKYLVKILKFCEISIRTDKFNNQFEEVFNELVFLDSLYSSMLVALHYL